MKQEQVEYTFKIRIVKPDEITRKRAHIENTLPAKYIRDLAKLFVTQGLTVLETSLTEKSLTVTTYDPTPSIIEEEIDGEKKGKEKNNV